MSEQDRTNELNQPLATVGPGEHFDLVDFLIAILKHKKLVLGVPLLVGVVTALITLLVPNTYVGTTQIVPPQQQQASAMALLGQLGPLAGLGGSALGIKNPADLYVGMLKSRTIADRLVNRFKLQDLYREDTLVDTRNALERATDITVRKDGIISVSVEDHDPQRAADIANAYIEELGELTQTLAVTEAAQRRLFFEGQLRTAKDDLAGAEIALRKTQEATGLIQLEGQAQAIITAISTLRAHIVAKESEISALRSGVTQQNPDYIRLQQQLISLRRELEGLQRKHKLGAGGDVIMPTGNLPQAGLEYVRRLRDVKYHEALFEVLAKQYELAKIDEASEAVTIQVVDKAVSPDKKTKPKRALIALVAAFGMLLVCVAIACVREFGSRSHRRADQLALLRRHLRS
jgi:tyrosine-protein kinase Etk/Wzc